MFIAPAAGVWHVWYEEARKDVGQRDAVKVGKLTFYLMHKMV